MNNFVAYIVKTEAPRGPRSKFSETFVVMAINEAMAKRTAVTAAHEGATVKSVELVNVCKRVSVGS